MSPDDLPSPDPLVGAAPRARRAPDPVRDPWGENLRSVVGDKTAKALAAAPLRLHTVRDLLLHYPRRYAERGRLTPLDSLVPDEHATVMAEVVSATTRPMRQRRGNLLEVVVTDGRSRVGLTFFNQQWRVRELGPGTPALFSGEVRRFNGKLQLSNPDYLLLDGAGADALDYAGALIPVYPASSAMPSWKVARAVELVLPRAGEAAETLPEVLRAELGLGGRAEALATVHRPADAEALEAAQARLRFDEALLLQTVLARRRAATARLTGASRRAVQGGLADAVDAALPFALTAGQREVGEVLAAELAQDSPMHRLLQGEVGSGKTVVALRAMATVVDAGGQAALLAPTEVLATQHARGLSALLGPLGRAGELDAAPGATRVVLLTGSATAAGRRAALAEIADGSAGIVVGTHALLEDRVRFHDLGLVVVDEQHRFGVEQRDALRAKGGSPDAPVVPHVLVMTATPIPRTVAMTVFGDLEVSSLRELPAGRSPLATSVVPVAEKPAWIDRAWARVRDEVAAGHQAFVVCPRIGDDPDGGPDDAAGGPDDADAPDPDEDAPARRPAVAVLDVAPMLAAGPFAGLRLGVLHGRLPADEKDAVMRSFSAGHLDVLVATTVVEVGVDVPNATVMVILDADRFGVSQLHQLRGRVGRGSAPGLCLLATEAGSGTPARERLDAVAATTDGFALARVDLEQRREGDVLGATQSGRRSHLRLLRLLRDEDVLVRAREVATGLVADDPDLTGLPALAAEVGALLDDERAGYLEKT